MLPFVNIYIFNVLLDGLTEESIYPPKVVWLAGIMIVLSAVLVLLSNAQSIINGDSNTKVGIYLKDRYLQKLVALPMSFLDTPDGRDTIDAANAELGSLYAFFEFFSDFLCSIYSFILAAMVLIQYNYLLAGVFFILSIPGCIVSYRASLISDKFTYKHLAENRFHRYYRQILTGQATAKDVRMYNLTEPLKSRYFFFHNKYLKERKQLKTSILKINTFYNIVPQIGVCIFLVYLVIEKMNNHISVGNLIMYSGIALTYISGIGGIAGGFDYSLCFVRWLQPVFKFFDMSCPEESTSGRTLHTFESLEFRNVYFRYPCAEEYVLKGVSFQLNQGEKMSIIGINGAGKTTIVKIMIGLYEIESGEILINGNLMKEYKISDIRKIFSVLFQDFVSYPLTLRENVILSNIKCKHTDDEVIAALKKSGAYKEIQKYNGTLNTYMTHQFDDNGIELSKGQWQKIALARAYLKNAPVIIYDEPSAALDAEAEEQIFRTFDELADNKTGIMISHRISGVRNSDKILVLNNGQIEEMGKHDELIKADGLYKQMYHLQKSKYQMAESGEYDEE